jgi:hydrogenase maturation factor
MMALEAVQLEVGRMTLGIALLGVGMMALLEIVGQFVLVATGIAMEVV